MIATDNVVEINNWREMSINTARGGYHYIASNPYLTMGSIAIIAIILLAVVMFFIVLIAKAFNREEIVIPHQATIGKGEHKECDCVCTPKKKVSKKKVVSKKRSSKKKA